MQNYQLLHIRSPSLSHLLLLLLLLFFFGSFHGVRSAFSPICDTASSFARCGDIHIQYPFWMVSDAHMHCGYPGLGLNCSAGYDYPILYFLGGTFFVTEINYVNKTLTIVEIDVPGWGCPRPLHNISMALSPLDHTSANVNLTFLYNCSVRPPPPSPLVAIDCLRFGDKRSYVFVKKNPKKAAAARALDCEEVSVAVVKGMEVTVARVVEVEVSQAMVKGFIMEWEEAKDCGGCEKSGGRCAFHWKEHVHCFCNDGSIHTDGSFCKGRKGRACGLSIFLTYLGDGFCIFLANRLCAWIPA